MPPRRHRIQTWSSAPVASGILRSVVLWRLGCGERLPVYVLLATKILHGASFSFNRWIEWHRPARPCQHVGEALPACPRPKSIDARGLRQLSPSFLSVFISWQRVWGFTMPLSASSESDSSVTDISIAHTQCGADSAIAHNLRGLAHKVMCDVQHCPGHAAASARPGHATASAWPRGRGFVAVLLFFLCRLQGEAPEDSQDVSFPETGVVRSIY